MTDEEEKGTSNLENLRSSFEELSSIDVEKTREKRSLCDKCLRPSTVCWCPYLPKETLKLLKTNVVILQHPFEEKRRLQTAIMLKRSLAEGQCTILKGKRFSPKRHQILEHVLHPTDMHRSILVYPSAEAISLSDYMKTVDSCYQHNVVLIDGTWLQAKGIFNQNPSIQSIQQVKLETSFKSEYVVRTQPSDSCLSTLECAAEVLSVLEQQPDLRIELIKPLKALCKFQLDYGACEHQSKQYLIEMGLYKKQPIKRNDRPKKKSARAEYKQLYHVNQEKHFT